MAAFTSRSEICSSRFVGLSELRFGTIVVPGKFRLLGCSVSFENISSVPLSLHGGYYTLYPSHLLCYHIGMTVLQRVCFGILFFIFKKLISSHVPKPALGAAYKFTKLILLIEVGCLQLCRTFIFLPLFNNYFSQVSKVLVPPRFLWLLDLPLTCLVRS